MNQELIKFIELCLMDGIITDKEREVIFRKGKELGIPEDEIEIILEGMIQKMKNKSEIEENGGNDNTSNKTVSDEKKSLELSFNNLKDSEKLKHEIDDFTFVKEKKEILKEDSIKKIQDDLISLYKNRIAISEKSDYDIFEKSIRERIIKTRYFEELLSILLIEKDYFKDITSELDGILLKFEIYVNYHGFFYVIFKKQKNEIIRYVIKRNYLVGNSYEERENIYDRFFSYEGDLIGQNSKEFTTDSHFKLVDTPIELTITPKEFLDKFNRLSEVRYEFENPKEVENILNILNFLSFKTSI